MSQCFFLAVNEATLKRFRMHAKSVNYSHLTTVVGSELFIRMKIFENCETYKSFFFQTSLMYITIDNLEHLTEVVWSLLQV